MKQSKMKRAGKKAIQFNLPKVSSGIRGFDEISFGGIPRGRATLVTGTAGSGKTVFATQFLYNGAMEYGENAVFVTFEETPANIMQNMKGFGWDIESLVKQKKWAFVDASMQDTTELEKGHYDLGALLARVENAVKKTKAKRIAIDSMSALLARYADVGLVRSEMYRITELLGSMGVTSIITAERMTENESASRFGVESFVTDNVIVLSNALNSAGERERSIEVLKYRGAPHSNFQLPFEVDSHGILVFPKPVLALDAKGFSYKESCGIPSIDKLFCGGVYTNSVTLITGTSGTGKTVMAIQFVLGMLKKKQACLYISFDESKEQIMSIAKGFGWDLEKYEKTGFLTFICRSPRRRCSLKLLNDVHRIIKRKKIKRAVVDSITAMRDAVPEAEFREFNRSLITYFKKMNVNMVVNASTAALVGSKEISEPHLLSMTDNIMLLRYVEENGNLSRVMTVLKTRGSDHDKRLWKYEIGSKGVKMIEPMSEYSEILSGIAKRK